MAKKPKPVAIFGADTHISEAVWSQRPRLRGDAFFGFSQLVDIALAENAPLVLAGDCLELLDSTGLTSLTLKFVTEQIERLRQAELPLYYISGQHDVASPSWLSAMSPWAIDVSGSVFKLGDRMWYGLNFQEGPALKVAMEMRPEAYGLLLHQRWAELTGGRGHQGSLAEVGKARVVVTGDMHLKAHKTVGKTHVFSPGATHKRRVDEPDKHYAVVAYADGSFGFRQIRSRRTLRVHMDPMQNSRRQLSDIVDKVRAMLDDEATLELPVELRQPFVIFDAGGHFENAYSRLSEDLQDAAHVFTRGKRKDESHEVTSQQPTQSDVERRNHLASVYEHVVANKVADPLVREILLRSQRGESLSEESNA